MLIMARILRNSELHRTINALAGNTFKILQLLMGLSHFLNYSYHICSLLENERFCLLQLLFLLKNKLVCAYFGGVI